MVSDSLQKKMGSVVRGLPPDRPLRLGASRPLAVEPISALPEM